MSSECSIDLLENDASKEGVEPKHHGRLFFLTRFLLKEPKQIRYTTPVFWNTYHIQLKNELAVTSEYSPTMPPRRRKTPVSAVVAGTWEAEQTFQSKSLPANFWLTNDNPPSLCSQAADVVSCSLPESPTCDPKSSSSNRSLWPCSFDTARAMTKHDQSRPPQSGKQRPNPATRPPQSDDLDVTTHLLHAFDCLTIEIL
jgi:hypothetical protein